MSDLVFCKIVTLVYPVFETSQIVWMCMGGSTGLEYWSLSQNSDPSFCVLLFFSPVFSSQNFIICMEMLVAAIAHYYIFSHKPYIDPAAAHVPCVTSCLRMFDVKDMAEDVKEHFVDPPRRQLSSVKRRFSRKSIQYKELNETAPLLDPYDEEDEQVPGAAEPQTETEAIRVVVHSHAEPDLESGSEPQKVEAEVVEPESDSPQAKAAVILELESDSQKSNVAIVLETESDSPKAEVPVALELETESPKAEVLESEMAEFVAMADSQKDGSEVPT